MISFSSAIIFFCGGLLIITGVSQLAISKRSEQNYILAAFLFCVASYQIRSEMIFSGIMEIYPHLSIFYTSTTYLTGPLVYYYFKIVLNPQWKSSRKMWPHFIIPVLIITAEIYAFLFMPAEVMISIFQKMHFSETLPITNRIAGISIGISHLCYEFFILKNLFGLYRFKELKGLHITILFLVTSIMLLSVIPIIGYVLNDMDFKKWALYFLCIHQIVTFLLAHRHPELLDVIRKEIVKERYQKSQMLDLDSKDVHKRLTELMEYEKFYTDENISLGSLSRRLAITPHQLSEFLNRYRNVNFYTFITTYRIDEAKRLLLKDEDLTVLKIAYNVGFNSKSAFNSAFQKFTGTTPQNFRKSKDL